MTTERRIVIKTRGQRHGPITRVMSPGDLGEKVKPFVFLDYVDAPGGAGPNFGFHPHSGIATLTYPITFDIQHETSSGQVDLVHRGGVEWVVSGNGIWHRAQPLNGESLQGFQTWFALPPSHENAASSAQFVQPEAVPRSGPVTVLLGNYGDAVSSVKAPFDANYFWVQLKDGEHFDYAPPATHQIAWVFAQSGTLQVSGESLSREMAIFEESTGKLTFKAVGDCGFLFGSAAKAERELVLGNYSVHSSASALASGERHIAEIGEQMRVK